MAMNEEQLERYSRHILLPQMGRDGQQKIVDASVLIIGVGGLGSPIAMYLAASGVGEMTLVDFDRVELSNLQRQIIHAESFVGQPKLASARERLSGMPFGGWPEFPPSTVDADSADN